MPWIGKTRDNCASFEDDVLFCPVLFQMFTRCVPVHPDVIVLFQCFICFVNCCTCVADVFICRNCNVYHQI